MNYGLSKSAKIVLSKSIFYVKNRNQKKNSLKNINLGATFLFIQWNLDLRKPDLRKNLDLRKIVGTTDFLVHKLFDLRKIF